MVKRIIFIVTQDCQLRCRYCYLVGKNSKGVMSWDMAKSIADFLLTLPVGEDSVLFDFIGGEPLLEIDIISRICDYLVNEMNRINHPWVNKYSIRIVTNGLLYSSKKTQKFVRKFRNHLSIHFSLDGTKQKHDLNRTFPNGDGSYDKLKPNIELWLMQYKDCATSYMVISHDDLPYLSDSILHLLQLGIKNINCNFTIEDVWKDGDAEILEDQLIKVADYLIENNLWQDTNITLFKEQLGLPNPNDDICPCGNLMYVFDSSGNIYTCMRFASYSQNKKEPRIIGNIKDGINYNKLRPMYLFNKEACYSHECLECEIESGCKWCPAESYNESSTGTMFIRTMNICNVYKANIRAKNYYWNRIKLIESKE